MAYVVKMLHSAKTSPQSHIHRPFLFLPQFYDHFFLNEAIINMTPEEGPEDSLHEQRKP